MDARSGANLHIGTFSCFRMNAFVAFGRNSFGICFGGLQLTPANNEPLVNAYGLADNRNGFRWYIENVSVLGPRGICQTVFHTHVSDCWTFSCDFSVGLLIRVGVARGWIAANRRGWFCRWLVASHR